MALNFSQLKTQFIQYLITQNKLEGNNATIDPSDISVFDYSEEFTEYLAEYTQLFNSDFKLDYSQIPDALINQEIDDDMLALMDEAIMNPESVSNEADFVNQLLGDVLKDEEVITQLDKDADGTLNKEEIQSFIDFINKNDGDTQNLTMTDIKAGLEQLKNKEYNKDANSTIIEVPESTLTDKTPSGTDSNYSPSSPNTNNNNNNSDVNGNNTDNTATETKNYTAMSLEQLTSEKSTMEQEVKTATEDVNKVHNGTNEAVAHAEKDAADKEAAYQEALKNDEKVSSELKESSAKNLENISKKENTIDSLKIDLNNKELAISQKTSEVNTFNTTYTALQVAQGQLSTQTSDDPEITSQIATKKSEVETQIKTVEQNMKTAQSDLENLKKEKEAIEKNIEKEENELKTLNDEKAEIDAQILANCGEETKTALEAYNTSKANVETVKATELEKANANLETKQSELEKIESVMHEKNASKIVKDNTVKTTKDVFDPTAELDFIYVPAKDGTMPYLMIGPKNVDPNAELPLLVYLHGSGEFGNNQKTIESQVGPGSILRDWNLQNFNGYIICPHATGDFNTKDWKGEDAVENIRTLVDDFTSTHNVDSDRISIAGHSAGGIGAENIALAMPDVFKRVAVLSGYSSSKDITGLDAEVRGYVGTNDCQYSKAYMDGQFQEEVGEGKLTTLKSSHAGLPKAVFNLDADGDGKADVLEFLFFADDE